MLIHPFKYKNSITEGLIAADRSKRNIDWSRCMDNLNSGFETPDTIINRDNGPSIVQWRLLIQSFELRSTSHLFNNLNKGFIKSIWERYSLQTAFEGMRLSVKSLTSAKPNASVICPKSILTNANPILALHVVLYIRETLKQIWVEDVRQMHTSTGVIWSL